MAFERSKIMVGREITHGPEYIHSHSRVPGEVPPASDLRDGELALNLADKVAYGKNDTGGVVEYGGRFSSVLPVSRVSAGPHTVGDGDQTIVTTASVVVNLPRSLGQGRVLRIKHIGSGTVTVAGAGDDSIDGAGEKLLSQYDCMTVADYEEGTWIII